MQTVFFSYDLRYSRGNDPRIQKRNIFFSLTIIMNRKKTSLFLLFSFVNKFVHVMIISF